VDYAEAAVAVLTSEGHYGKTCELAGDNAYTLTDLAAEISRQTVRDIPYRNLREAEYAAAVAGFGVPETAARAYARFDAAAAQGALFDDGPVAVSVARGSRQQTLNGPTFLSRRLYDPDSLHTPFRRWLRFT
jgi:uncharacterized protein YbjT (DUF2867 family)